jgi:hypothetical protein
MKDIYLADTFYNFDEFVAGNKRLEDFNNVYDGKLCASFCVCIHFYGYIWILNQSVEFMCIW